MLDNYCIKGPQAVQLISSLGSFSQTKITNTLSPLQLLKAVPYKPRILTTPGDS